MDYSALKNISSYRMSLADFMTSGSKAKGFQSSAQALLDTVAARYSGAAQAGQESVTGDTVTLSDEAKALLDATGSDSESLTPVQQGAQNLVIAFFDQSGVNPVKLTDEVLDIIEGLNGVIAGASGTARDIATDSMEMRYGENGKKVYTLAGNGSRLRVAIDYADDKTTPVKMTITDITGGQVETAAISLAKNEDGVMRLNIERSQLEYKNGHMVKAGDIEPMSLKLYTA